MSDRLKFSQEEKSPKEPTSSPSKPKRIKQIQKLEQQSERHKKRSDRAIEALHTRKIKQRKRVYDEEKGKSKKVLHFEQELIPIGDNRWNQPKKKGLPRKVIGGVGRITVNKMHLAVHSSEHENVGTKAAHRAELMGESALRGGRRAANSAYRFYKNKPYRKAAKFEAKSIRTDTKLSYRKALNAAPPKKIALSRYFQKRRIKRKYAQMKRAKKSGLTTYKAMGLFVKGAAFIKGIIIKKKLLLLLIKPALLVLVIVMLLGMLSMCVAMFSGGGGFLSAVVYSAEYEDIDLAEIAYGEWTTDLIIYINEIEQNYPDYDEYRFNIGLIDHNPFELIAFLTVVYDDFTFAQVEPTLRALFA